MWTIYTLIYKVRAELPCELSSETWTNCREETDDDGETWPRERWCRTCDAREKLGIDD